MKLHLGITRLYKIIRRIYLYIRYKFIKKIYNPTEGINYLAKNDSDTLIKALRKGGAKIGENVDIQIPILFHQVRDFKKLTIGDYSHIGKTTFLDLSDDIIIGNRVTISMGSMLITHIDVGASKLSTLYPKKKNKVIIGDDSYLGCQSTILAGVKLGSNNLVAAKSLVLHSTPDSVLVAGIPARIIKYI